MTVVNAILSSEVEPPNIVTSVRPGAREIAVTECLLLVDGISLGSVSCSTHVNNNNFYKHHYILGLIGQSSANNTIAYLFTCACSCFYSWIDNWLLITFTYIAIYTSCKLLNYVYIHKTDLLPPSVGHIK